MEIANKNIVIAGLARTGAAVARFLRERGADVTISDRSERSELKISPDDLEEAGIRLELGGHLDETFENADLVVLSPGVPHDIPPVLKARKKGVPVTGEIELASRFIDEPIIAITGTNGKTTTTTLLGQMLEASGFSVFVGGNIGNPLTDYAAGEEKADLVVLEVSSFQLDTISSFRPVTAIILNITDDHLDRYDDFKGYVDSKARIFMNQTENDTAVINAGDPNMAGITSSVKSRVCPFNARNDASCGARVKGGFIELITENQVTAVIDVSGSELKGRHNLENISAAAIAALSVGASPRGIQNAVDSFRNLPHRIEYVDRIDGIQFYDDSKGTNVDAVVKAVETFESPVVLIMGGLDKGGNFSLLKETKPGKIKKLILIGKARSIIRKALEDAFPAEDAADMADAVRKAFKTCTAGDTVLLSPGCASFDMFKSYGHRGDVFKEAVATLKLTTKQSA